MGNPRSMPSPQKAGVSKKEIIMKKQQWKKTHGPNVGVQKCQNYNLD